jgi:hypothetical protein
MGSSRSGALLVIAAIVVLIVSAVPASAHGDDLDATGATHQTSSLYAFGALPELDPAGATPRLRD